MTYMKTANDISIKRSFLVIQGVVGLLLVFLIVQSGILWRVCNQRVDAATGLEKEGLPSLRLLASLQEDLAIYRLHSYELMFAQDKDRPAKIAETDAVQQQNTETLQAVEQTVSRRRRPSICGQPLRPVLTTMSKPWAGSAARLTRILPAP